MDILWLPVRAFSYGGSPVGHLMAVTGAGAIPLEDLDSTGQKKALQTLRKALRDCLGLPTGPPSRPRKERATTQGPSKPDPAQAPPPQAHPALKIWQDKLAKLQVAEAIASNANQKIELGYQIEEAKAKIEELSR